MDIHKATKQYEAWLGARTSLVKADLAYKHEQMTAGLFPFLRATYYRWAQLWPQTCPEFTKAPSVLAVGDLHIENFGTWRDREGRLVWGVNDFDEASPMPYTNDLVRLATSTLMAIAEDRLRIDAAAACKAILAGYADGLKAGGLPVVLAERHSSLRDSALKQLGDPVTFWQGMNALPVVIEHIPASALEGLEHSLPGCGLDYRIRSRRAGLGSLGHRRYVATAEWRGGLAAREAKALVPSSYLWAQGHSDSVEILYQTLLSRAVRCPDPFVQLRGMWIVRRLAPDCTRIELGTLAGVDAEQRLLSAMGWETANIHLGTPEAIKEIRRDVKDRSGGWLLDAAEAMHRETLCDWNDWKKK